MPDCLGLIIPRKAPAPAVPRSDTKPTHSSLQACPAPCPSKDQDVAAAPSVLRTPPGLICGSYTPQFCPRGFLPHRAWTSPETTAKHSQLWPGTSGAHSPYCSSSWPKQGFLQVRRGPWMYLGDPPGAPATSEAKLGTDPTTLLSLELLTSPRHFLPMCPPQALPWERSWDRDEG